MERLPDWRVRLAEWLEEVRNQPFAQGRHDCALFAAGAVRAVTGTDLAEVYRGRYRTTRGGLRILRKAGFDDHVALALHHFARQPIALVREGDLVVSDTDQGPGFGVVQGAAAYVLGQNGLALMALSQARLALKVG